MVATKDTGMERRGTHKNGLRDIRKDWANWAILWDIDWKRDI